MTQQILKQQRSSGTALTEAAPDISSSMRQIGPVKFSLLATLLTDMDYLTSAFPYLGEAALKELGNGIRFDSSPL
jgi:hypothetical protein